MNFLILWNINDTILQNTTPYHALSLYLNFQDLTIFVSHKSIFSEDVVVQMSH